MKAALFLAIAAVVLWCSYRIGWRRGERAGIRNGLNCGRAVGWDDHRRLMGEE